MAIESSLSILTIISEVSFITKGDKEKEKGIEVAFSFILPVSIVEFVVREYTFTKFAIDYFAIFVNSRFDIVSNKVIQTYIFHIFRSLGIEEQKYLWN